MKRTFYPAIILSVAVSISACSLNVSVPSRIDMFVHETPSGLVCGYMCATATERARSVICTPMKENPDECSQKFSPAVSEMSRLPGKYTP